MNNDTPIGNPWVLEASAGSKHGPCFFSQTMRMPGFGISPVLDDLDRARRFRTEANALAEARRLGRKYFIPMRWSEAAELEAAWKAGKPAREAAAEAERQARSEKAHQMNAAKRAKAQRR